MLQVLIITSQINSIIAKVHTSKVAYIKNALYCFYYATKHTKFDLNANDFGPVYLASKTPADVKTNVETWHFDMQNIIERAKWSFNRNNPECGPNYLADSWVYILTVTQNFEALEVLEAAISGLIKPKAEAPIMPCNKVVPVKPKSLDTVNERSDFPSNHDYLVDSFSDADPGL